ncbi:MAG TPA: hypothetical protein VEX37_09110, partial [Thermomicrobiales bacterium]|nr:hypothetical protein [Thermomicrobiales bacterium]
EPPRKRDQSPPVKRTSERAIRRAEPAPSIEFSATPPTFGNPNRPRRSEPQPDLVEKRPIEGSNGTSARSSLARGETEPLPSAAEVRDAVSKDRERKAKPVTLENHATPEFVDLTPEANSFSSTSVPVDLPPAIEQRPTTWYTGAGKIATPGISKDAPAALAVDPIDLARGLQTVRRCCATCRDFKQVGDGRTGSCNNPYAFAEKRMVQSNEIACRSSLGVWWLPHDELWLEQADTSHHGRPTPLLDDMVSAVPAEERHGMGQRSSR